MAKSIQLRPDLLEALQSRGLDVTKPVILLLAHAVEQAIGVDSNGDGDVSTLEIVNVVQNIFFRAMGSLRLSVADFKAELFDLDDNEIVAIADAVSNELDELSDRTRRIARKSMLAIGHTADLVIEITQKEAA